MSTADDHPQGRPAVNLRHPCENDRSKHAVRPGRSEEIVVTIPDGGQDAAFPTSGSEWGVEEERRSRRVRVASPTPRHPEAERAIAFFVGRQDNRLGAGSVHRGPHADVDRANHVRGTISTVEGGHTVSDETGNDGEREPSPRRTLGRMAYHALQILFYVGLEWVIDLALRYTGQKQTWWAPIALAGTGAMFLISLFVIGGSELIGDCAEAVRVMLRRIRRR